MIRRIAAGLIAAAVAAASCTAELDVLRPDDGSCLGPAHGCAEPADCCSGRCEGGMCPEEDVCQKIGDECELDEDCCTERCVESACVEQPARS